jgi:hypothetical protein
MAPGIPDRVSSVRSSDLAIFSGIQTWSSPRLRSMIVERLKLALGAAAAAVRDEQQNLLEHLSWDSDLSHLEDNIAAVAHNLPTDLDQFLFQARQRPVLDRLWPRQGA